MNFLSWAEVVTSVMLFSISLTASVLYAYRVVSRSPKSRFVWPVLGLFISLVLLTVPLLLGALEVVGVVHQIDNSAASVVLEALLLSLVLLFTHPLFRDAFQEFKAYRAFKRAEKSDSARTKIKD